MLLPRGKQSRFGANAYPYYLLESEQKQMNLFSERKIYTSDPRQDKVLFLSCICMMAPQAVSQFPLTCLGSAGSLMTM